MGDGLVELAPFQGIFYGLVNGDLAAAQIRRAQFVPPDVENIEGDVVSFAHFAEYIFYRYFYIIEDKLGGAGTFQSHFHFFRTAFHAGRIHFDQKGGEFFAVHFGVQDDQVAPAAVGDKLFDAVQHVIFTVFAEHRRCFGGQSVRTGTRLGERISADPFAAAQLRQIFFLLLGRAVQNDGQGADARMGGKGGGKGTRLAHGNFFGDNGRGYFIHTQPAVFFRNVHAQQTQLAALLHQIARQLAVQRFDLFFARQNLLFGEFQRECGYFFLFIGKGFRGKNRG